MQPTLQPFVSRLWLQNRALIGALAVVTVACSQTPTTSADDDQDDGQSSTKAEDSMATTASESTKTEDATSMKPGGGGGDSPEMDAGEPDELPDPSIKFDLGAIPDFDSKMDEIRPCEIDFLFVVDNSGSMGIKQENLANSVPHFIDSMMNSTDMEKNYHIGVVTTDESPGNITKCAFTGGLVVQTQNFDEVDFCGPYQSGLSYMTEADDLPQRFGCAATPGISGNTEEKAIDAIRGALNPENARKGRCNESFLRDEGLLVVVIITDEDDREEIGGSSGTPEQWYQELLAAKGGDEKKLVVLSIVVPPKPNACKPGDLLAKETKRLIAFTKKFGARGFVADVCEDDYGPTFDKAISIIDFACEELHPPPG